MAECPDDAFKPPSAFKHLVSIFPTSLKLNCKGNTAVVLPEVQGVS